MHNADNQWDDGDSQSPGLCLNTPEIAKAPRVMASLQSTSSTTEQ